ncbi:MAG: hypothetical protein HY833_01820 [Candidatus Aenigmarchaeota archaeon]|nr:hypothetical protein [Candidatus Aenigmarchaeota archaeon]
MSWVGGAYLNHKYAKDGLPAMLGPNMGAAEGLYAGFIPGEIIHMSPPNARSQMMIDTPLGKASGIFFGFMWQMRKRGFHIVKANEWIEVSPVHSQYYQLTVQQKQTLEGQIKAALHSVHTSISDAELIYHDMRRYKEYMNYFERLEEAKTKKNMEEYKKNNQTLKSIFIDQVDVHTGEGVALKLIVSRWPTIIVDFMRISDEDDDPGKIATKYQFSEAEGVVLATKNKLYKEWRELFKGTVMGRWENLRELSSARKRSIGEYRNMVKPYIMRHKMIREMGETKTGRDVLQGFSWWRPSTQAVSIDAAEYWMWKPFWPPEIHRPSLQYFKEKIPITRMRYPKDMKDSISDNWDIVKEKGYAELETFLTGIEPVDKWVWYLKDTMSKWYKDNFNYRAKLDLIDVLDARKELNDMYTEYGRWDWLPSPYFMCLEVETFRVVVRNPDGTESETFILGDYPRHPLMCPLDSQNVILLRLLELKLQQKEVENYITDMVGESVDGQKLEDAIKNDYPNLFNKGNKVKTIKNEAKGKLKKPTDWERSFKLTRSSGLYDTIFMERVAAIMLKEVNGTAYALARGYFRSAVGVP